MLRYLSLEGQKPVSPGNQNDVFSGFVKVQKFPFLSFGGFLPASVVFSNLRADSTGERPSK